MAAFRKGNSFVHRRVVLNNISAAVSFDIPAGAWGIRMYARNKGATATNVSLGNSVGGTQFATATAVPTGTAALPGYVVVPLTNVAPSNVVTNMHVTLSSYALALVDVTIEFAELEDSLPIPTQHSPISY